MPAGVRRSLAGPGHPLEPAARTDMERRFGWDFGAIRIHADDGAAVSADALGARAYTAGPHVVFGRGEYAPGTAAGRFLLAHELAHAVQRGAPGGTARSGLAMGGLGDREEREADAAARSAGAGPLPAHALLGAAHLPIPALSSRVLRRAPKGGDCKHGTWAGCFDYEWYAPTRQTDSKETRYGVDIKILFTPNDNVNAEKIALVQTAQSSLNDEPVSIYFRDPPASGNVGDVDVGPRIRGIAKRDFGAKAKDTALGRMVDPVLPAAGTAIDAMPATRTPLTAMLDPDKGSELADSKESKYATYGKHFTQGKKKEHGDATMRDLPGLLAKGAGAHQVFETTALAVTGAQKGTYYGSVEWGWRKTASEDKATPLDFKIRRETTPTSDFDEARKLWNVSKTSKDEASIPLPTTAEMFTSAKVALMDKPVKGTRLEQLPQNTRVEVIGGQSGWTSVVVTKGSLAGKLGWIADGNLSDRPVEKKQAGRK